MSSNALQGHGGKPPVQRLHFVERRQQIGALARERANAVFYVLERSHTLNFTDIDYFEER
jgi:hypothetical protein